jgi:dihydrofolate reductase
MKLAIIAAVADNGVIGREGGLPWRLPADLRRFKALTMGHHLLMGRTTFEADVGGPLPGRTIVVISRGRPELPAGVHLAASLDAAIAIARTAGDPEPLVAGGAEIYRLALPRADRLYLTRVHARPAGDTVFPPIDEAAWREIEREERPADDDNPHPLSFLVYERAAAP